MNACSDAGRTGRPTTYWYWSSWCRTALQAPRQPVDAPTIATRMIETRRSTLRFGNASEGRCKAKVCDLEMLQRGLLFPPHLDQRVVLSPRHLEGRCEAKVCGLLRQLKSSALPLGFRRSGPSRRSFLADENRERRDLCALPTTVAAIQPAGRRTGKPWHGPCVPGAGSGCSASSPLPRDLIGWILARWRPDRVVR